MKNIINYHGFEITVKQTPPTRFGSLFYAADNYGEPVLQQLYFQTLEQAIADGKKNLDACLEEN